MSVNLETPGFAVRHALWDGTVPLLQQDCGGRRRFNQQLHGFKARQSNEKKLFTAQKCGFPADSDDSSDYHGYELAATRPLPFQTSDHTSVSN